jgi:hypothetical protein
MDGKTHGLARWIRLGSIPGLTLILAAAWTGCSKDSGPTQPVDSLRVIVIGSLTALSDSVSSFEATSSFDGAQGASNHSDPPYRTLNLRGSFRCTRGSHTVGYQLASQSCDPSPCAGRQAYRVGGEVSVYDSNGALVQVIPLAEKTAQMTVADVVTYPIGVNP